MNDKNFDSLKNLKTPDSWIENALNIPKVQEKKPIFFIRYSRHLMAVACLVLVCTISLLVVLNKNDGSVLVVDPDYETVQTDDKNNESEAHTDSSTDTPKIDKNDKKKPVDDHHGINGSAPYESTQNNDKPSKPQNSKPQNPTDKPVVGPTFPTEKDENSTNAPESLPTPTVRPTRPPDSKPPVKPVNRPNTPSSTESNPPQAIPTEDYTPGIPSQEVTFSLIVDKFYLTSNEDVLCAVAGSDNKEILSDVQAILSPYGNYALAYISIPKDYFTKSGEYTCCFYSSNGYYIGSSVEYVW